MHTVTPSYIRLVHSYPQPTTAAQGMWSCRWGRHDTDLVCLTQLQQLQISAELVSPAVVSALAALPSLTHMHLDQLDWRRYGGMEEEAEAEQQPGGAMESYASCVHLAKALRGLTVSER